MAEALVIVLLAGLVLVGVAIGRGCARRASYEATLARVHPELARTLPRHGAGFGEVAARAGDLATSPAPRQLGDQVVHG